MKRLKTLDSIKRSGYMLRLGFRDDRQNAHAMHIQCHWRFVRGGRIVVGSFDLSRLRDDKLKDLWGNTLADTLIEKLEKALPANIIGIERKPLGDLRIVLDCDLAFECFIDTSSQELECWRWIDCSFDSPRHTVFNEEEG